MIRTVPVAPLMSTHSCCRNGHGRRGQSKQTELDLLVGGWTDVHAGNVENLRDESSATRTNAMDTSRLLEAAVVNAMDK